MLSKNVKLLFLFALILVTANSIKGNTMENDASLQNDFVTKQAIVKHVRQVLSVNEDKIEIEKLDLPLSSLPKKYSYYEVAKKDAGFSGLISFYIVADGELYSSAVDEDFSKILKHERFLETKNFTVSQFVSLYDFLCIGASKYSYTVNPPEHLDESLKQFKVLFDDDKNKLPQIKENKNGIEVIFWTRNTLADVWQRRTVRVSKDYKVAEELEESGEN